MRGVIVLLPAARPEAAAAAREQEWHIRVAVGGRALDVGAEEDDRLVQEGTVGGLDLSQLIDEIRVLRRKPVEDRGQLGELFGSARSSDVGGCAGESIEFQAHGWHSVGAPPTGPTDCHPWA